MPAHTHHEPAEHPTEGFRSVVLPGAPTRPVRVHLPTDYQPKYAYPLVALFHGEGEDEEHAARLVPLLSRRNYVTLCPRGPVKLGLRPDGRPAFGWSAAPDRLAKAAIEHLTGQFSVNPERVFLVGAGAGAAAAYRLALALRGRVSGVVALNGTLPIECVPDSALRVLIGHGTANPVVPVAQTRGAAARLSAAGATVRIIRYAGHRAHTDMLRDANRWIMAQVSDKTGE
jgi:phospholipase/carboxylesterase